VKILADW